MISKELIDYVTAHTVDGKMDTTKLWEFLAIHEKDVQEAERKRIKLLFTKVSGSIIEFLIEIDKKD